MDGQHYGKLFSFIWNIANDVLVFAFEKGDYKKIILPFTVLRRIDVLLEETKVKVLEKKAFCDKNKLPYEQFLPPVTGYPFYNSSAFTMSTLKNEIDPQRLKMNVLEYFNGFSPDVQDVIDKFQLRHWVDALTSKGRLGSILEKFTDTSINLSIKPVKDDDGRVILPGLDNHSMGTMFEELLRRFNEENNVTEAGEHFTPCDYVRLLARLAVEPIKDSLKDGTYTIYDGASGTGGILTVTQEEFDKVAKETGKKIKTMIFGQELQDDTYATCKADLMISGNIKKFTYRLGSSDHQYIACGSTISQDGHAGEKFDFCVMNPPFGTPWKEDLKNWGIGSKKEVSDPRFFDGQTSFVPDIGDCQMLFLANSISRMKNTELGTRIIEVHDSASIFGGDAGDGATNLRKHIIETDMLEAIIAMPMNDFYNTGIGTYIWIVTNRKEKRRKGKIQLIDAREMFTPLRVNLGEKKCYTSEDDADKILRLLKDFKETPQSKIFKNSDFGYWDVPVFRPKRNDDGELVLKKGKPVLAPSRGEFEHVPFTYQGGVEAFYKNEVKPYDDEVIFGEPVVGYELSFTRYFYKPVAQRSLDEIMVDVRAAEKNIADKLRQLQSTISSVMTRGVKKSAKFKDSGVWWLGDIPAHWNVVRNRACFTCDKTIVGAMSSNTQLLSLTTRGVRTKSTEVLSGKVPESFDGYQIVEPGDLVMCLFDLDCSAVFAGVSPYYGMISPAYRVMKCRSNILPAYAHYWFQYVFQGRKFVRFAKNLRFTLTFNEFAAIAIPLPPLEEQKEIVKRIERQIVEVENVQKDLTAEMSLLGEYRQRLIANCMIGKVEEV